MTTDKTGGGAGVQNQPVSAGNADTASPLDGLLQSTIGRKLRDSYQEVVNEEVPSKFLTLLDQLKKKESSSEDGQS